MVGHKDKIQILTADFGFQQYIVILVAGYHQSIDYFQETFIIGEGEPIFYYERRDTDKSPDGNSHEERCCNLLKLGLADAKHQLKMNLKEKYDLTKEIIYYQARNEIDNLKNDSDGWLVYLQNNAEIQNAVAQIKVKSKSDDLKAILNQQKQMSN